jgi:hypothetical protein
VTPIFAVSDAVWMAAIAAAVTIAGILQSIINVVIAYFQTRSLNQASKARSDNVVENVKAQSEIIGDHVVTKVAEQTALIQKNNPQDVVVVNKEPVEVRVENERTSHLGK